MGKGGLLTLRSDLRPFVLEHRNTTFVLIHFSKRYNENEIRAFFDDERKTQREAEAAEQASAESPSKPLAFENLVIWLEGLGSVVPTSS